jgi:hypothetical protein
MLTTLIALWQKFHIWIVLIPWWPGVYTEVTSCYVHELRGVLNRFANRCRWHHISLSSIGMQLRCKERA